MNVYDFLGLKVKDASIEPAAGSEEHAETAAATYFRAVALSTAISYKANALAMSTFHVYERHKEVKDDLWYALNFSPNPNQNASQFWNDLMERLCFDGEALVLPIKHHFYVAQGFHQEVRQLKENVFDCITVEDSNVARAFTADKCMYFRMTDHAQAVFVKKMLDSYAELMATAMSSYKATTGQKFNLEIDRAGTGSIKDEDDQQNMLKRNIKSFIEHSNSIYIQTRGQKLSPVKVENKVEPSEISDLRREIYDSAAVAFKIPKSVMYGDMTNMGDLVNTLLTFGVDPEAKMIADELTRKNFTADEVKAGSRVAVDTSTIKHIDLFDAAPSIAQLLSYGALTIDDVLIALGREPIGDDITSARLMTKNLGPIEDVLRQFSQTDSQTDGGGEQ